MNQEAEKLRDRVKTVLAEPLSDDQLAPIFNQVVDEFGRIHPASVDTLAAMRTRTSEHGQYRLSLEAVLEVLDRSLASDALADKYKEQATRLLARVGQLQSDLRSRLRR